VLAQERTMLRTLIDNLSDVVYFKDINSRFIAVSAQPHFGLHFPLDQFIGKTDLELFPKEIAERFYFEEQAILRSGVPMLNREEQSVHLDTGQPIWVLTTKVPVRDSQGKIVGLVGVSRDITERKLMEETLRKNEERLRAIFEQAAIGISFVGPTGAWLQVNQKVCDILGYTAEELRELTWQEMTHPDDLENDYQLAMRLLAGEMPTYSLEKRYLRKDGSYVWVRITCSTLGDASGVNTQYGITAIEDISERKQAEEALRANEIRYRLLMEQASDAIFVADEQANYVDVNDAACQLLGYTRDELLRLNVKNVVSPEDLAAVPIPWDTMRAGTIIMERRLVRKDGSRVPVEVSAKVLDDGRLQVFARDISERSRAEKQQLALELEQEKVALLGRFVGDASHDLRTPLSVMSTSVYLLRNLTDPSKQTRYLDNLEAQVAHIGRLIENMFTLSRLDMGVSQFQWVACNVDTLVRNVCARHERLASQKQHQIELKLASNLPCIFADQSEMATALGHLFVNALNYTMEGGLVTVSTYRRGQQVVIEVKDNGIGIGDEDLPLIFERFYRADKTRRMDTGNSGLGLTIARKIVEAHHGLIEVESQVNQGSTFRIVLPEYESRNGQA
jgi:PAS domain S-box-containing protein